MKDLKALKQHLENVFIRNSVYGKDWDFYAIGLINSDVKVSPKTVYDFYAHMFTYLHPECLNVKTVGWCNINIKDPDDRLDWVRNSCLNLYRIVGSYDSRLIEKIYTDEFIEKYHLDKKFLPTKKTVKTIKDLKLVVPKPKKTK